jgi:pSer/pThr/pTyr-binding forkhead associated (FHA) protein/ABC-type ATPase involved in cell division
VKARLPTIEAPDAGAIPATTLPGGAGSGAAGPEIVVHDGVRSFRIALGAAPITFGRDPENTVVLASRFVSGKHARVEPQGASYRILDLGSTNGLSRAGRRLPAGSPVPLSDGDVLRIGDPATGNFVSLSFHDPRARSAPAATTVVKRHPLPASRPRVLLGRAGSDIELDNPVVSRRHAVLERIGGALWLRDLGSTNGTFVDGRRIARQPLSPGAVIQIGPFKLGYDGQSLAQYDQRGALRIDGRRLSQEVGGGRLILRDVSISIAPRELVALVGGSGAGKSTLMKAMAGYLAPSRGLVTVNGDDFYAQLDAYRALLGYVPQDDTLHKELPVRRALAYTARLRLPADTDSAEIAQRIARVLDDVDMGRPRRKAGGPALRRPAQAGEHRRRAARRPLALLPRRAHLGPRSRPREEDDVHPAPPRRQRVAPSCW